MILLIDNYDSFVFNLARYFERLGQVTHVVRNDAISVAEIGDLSPKAIVLSPGPCTPTEAGVSLEIVTKLHATIPMLGVCLGHQTIAAALGAKVIRANEPMHGRTSPVFHRGEGVLADLPNPFDACRYHSLIVDESTLPTYLAGTAWTGDGTLMAIEHRELPVFGVQFHPEAILTTDGYRLLANFLRRGGLPVAEPLPNLGCEREEPLRPVSPLPVVPVTF